MSVCLLVEGCVDRCRQQWRLYEAGVPQRVWAVFVISVESRKAHCLVLSRACVSIRDASVSSNAIVIRENSVKRGK